MALIERLKRGITNRPNGTAAVADPADDSKRMAAEIAYQELKSRVHNQLFDYIDVSKLGKVTEDRIAEDVALVTRRILDEEQVVLTKVEREKLVREIQHEVFGLGPLEPFLQDPSVCDILVNGHQDVYVERAGRIEKTVARFKDDAHLMRIIDKITSAVGRRVDESNPMVDARLEDGSRVNVIIPPLALDGPLLSIRRFAVDPLTAEDLIGLGSLTPEVTKLLEGAVRGRLNIVISGGTGTGKTTLLNVLSAFVPENERIVTIEDSAELQLKQEHVARLETRPPNIEGRGQVTQRELVINSLRMRPDRIIVGEVRGGEALDMLQAMNTGHDGSITTIHANSPRDALSRIETLVAMTGFDIPSRAVRQQISSAIQIVIQLSRMPDGARKLSSIQEITSMESDTVTMQEIFTLDRRGVDERGRFVSDIVPTGIVPQFLRKLHLAGIDLPRDLFDVTGSLAMH